MRVGSGVILFQLAGFLTSALADFYFAKHRQIPFLNGRCSEPMFYFHIKMKNAI